MLTKDSSSMKAGRCTEPAWYQIKLSVVTIQSPTSTVMPKHADTAKKAIQYTTQPIYYDENGIDAYHQTRYVTQNE